MMALSNPPPAAAEGEPIDDYHVQPDPGQLVRPVTHHVLGAINGILLIILAVISFGLFWVVATLLEII
jgi:hypothetical protein